MQLKIPFRFARGVAVALFIVLTHFTLAWLFDNLRIPRPDLGPVFATLLGETEVDPPKPARADAEASTQVQILNDTPQPAAPR